MCFGIRKSTRFIWLLQYYPFRIISTQKTLEMNGRTHKFILFSYHQFNKGTGMFMRSNFKGCIWSFWQCFSHEQLYFICANNFQQRVKGFSFPGITHSKDNPRGMMSEISQSITHKDCPCFKEWITKFSAHFQFWKGITVPANTDSVWGAGAKSLQQRQQCLSRTSDGCQAVETFVCLWRF